MKYCRLGPEVEGIQISRMAFGCWAIGGHGYGTVDDRESILAVRKAWDLGVNLFDTANVYGFGHSEKILAEALGPNRHQAIIASKFGVNWDSNKQIFKDCSKKMLLQSLDASLRRLKIDCIPLYQIHWHDGKTSMQEIMETLQLCQEQGKIRYIGCSNFTSEMVREATRIHRLDAMQLPFNLIRQENQPFLLECSKQKNITTLVYDVLARGLFTGKYRMNSVFGKNDTRSKESYFSSENFSKNLRITETLRKIGKNHNKNPSHVAIRWTLLQKGVDSVIVGCKNADQVIENVKAMEWTLTSLEQKILENEVSTVL